VNDTLTVAELLARLSERGVSISRQAFHQSLLPLMIEDGVARKASAGVLVDAVEAENWIKYIAVATKMRQERAAPGGKRYKYNLDDYKLITGQS